MTAPLQENSVTSMDLDKWVNVRKMLNLYVARLQALEDGKPGLTSGQRRLMTVTTGSKFYKVVHETSYGIPAGGSVHSFVDKKTGDVYKAAAWAAPAKGIRYNLLTSGDEFWNNIDIYGSYLYQNQHYRVRSNTTKGARNV